MYSKTSVNWSHPTSERRSTNKWSTVSSYMSSAKVPLDVNVGLGR